MLMKIMVANVKFDRDLWQIFLDTVSVNKKIKRYTLRTYGYYGPRPLYKSK